MELETLRTENSKTYLTSDGKRRCVIGGICHYKDDYTDQNEKWKDIDLTPDKNGNITKAPYTAIRSNGAIVFTDKKTGDSVTIKPTKIGTNDATLADVAVVASPEGIKLQRVIKNADGALTAEYDISVNGSSINVKADAVDADGLKVPINHSIENGKMLEAIPELKAIDTDGTKKDIKYNVKVDPTLTIQPPNADNFIQSNAATSNYGSVAFVRVTEMSGAYVKSLLEFSLASLPAGAVISSATLSLYYYQYTYNPNGKVIDCCRMLRTDWSESQSTYTIYKTSNNWTTFGCSSDGNDFTSTNKASATMPASYGWVDWNVKDMVKDAVTAGHNALFLLKNSDTGFDCRFYSKDEVTETTKRPKLVIEYTTGWANIAKVNGIASSSYAKVRNIAVASIAKRRGIAV